MMQTDGFSINIHHPWSSLSVISKLMFVKKKQFLYREILYNEICMHFYVCLHTSIGNQFSE